MNILVTGGTGYIGSHTTVELIAAGHSVVIVDNLSNSEESVVSRLETLTATSIPFYAIDIQDTANLEAVFSDHKIEAVMHFAGLKAVGESSELPLKYYRNNLDSTLTLLEVMQNNDVKNFIFSSSATVYGPHAVVPYSEDQPVGRELANPYAETKYMIETILKDLVRADGSWRIASLRYFNPIGAHRSGTIGEKPTGAPNNLMPYLLQVAAGQRDSLMVFGDDYSTRDGSGIRDYIHVVDIAKGHLAALEHLSTGCTAYNLGSGKGTSVLELIATFEQTTSVPIHVKIADRRDGDLPEFFADITKAKQELGWGPTLSIADACRDAWHWQQTIV